MVTLQKLAPVELVEVPHPPPQFRAFPGRVALERDVRYGPDLHHGFQVTSADVALVGGNLRNLKPLCGRFEQRRQIGIVIGVRSPSFRHWLLRSS